MRYLIALIAGSLFGAGLFVSGMTDTTKVQGWLDVFGAWDPTLAFVMGGAILPMMVAWRLTANRAPLAGGQFPEAPGTQIDRKLVMGSVAFGAGWGLAGLCPGPAIASLSYGGAGGLVFLAAMLLGMGAAPRMGRYLDSPAHAA
ncbi:DUF6691 family protein [Aestuariivita boseongensis]|uniref:DUF6691 family protein n=1 Tax=Aestuariivita boseongensis TaxID=1470562 RepID=UPI000680D6E8|nr:DUF6691 family protein [Aestuariivita boseongensis]